MAVGLGAVTPFCSCSSIPLFIGFVGGRHPARRVTLSFLIASPMINEVAVVVLASVIGWKLTVIYVAAGLTVAFIGGFVIERFKPERWVEEYVWKIQVGETPREAPDVSLRGRHDYAVGQVKAIVGTHLEVRADRCRRRRRHSRLRAAGLRGAHRGDGGFLSVLGAGAGRVPLYSDAVGIIPIAEVLLGKGVPLGTVLAFMMAVTALSLPEMIHPAQGGALGRCSGCTPAIWPARSWWSGCCSTN